tara:strand:- start:384 stop:650 length:267 start_codon:yes stop_codon:yes gene_type:complete
MNSLKQELRFILFFSFGVAFFLILFHFESLPIVSSLLRGFEILFYDFNQTGITRLIIVFAKGLIAFVIWQIIERFLKLINQYLIKRKR